MIKIAHCGNYKGRDPGRENTAEYVTEAITAGYDVKIDVWLLDKEWYLGCYFPCEKITLAYLENNKLWVHAKNLEGFVSLWKQPKVHCFWHDKDDFTFTSMGIKWANVGVETHDGIMVMPEYSPDATNKLKEKLITPLGICSDDFSLFDPSAIPV